jgi:hypothetical protein
VSDPYRAALRGAHPGEHCSSGTWRTARAAQQSFSGVGKNARYGAMDRGALAHQAEEAWAPQRNASRACKLKNLNTKTTLKLKINPIWEYLGLIFYPLKP